MQLDCTYQMKDELMNKLTRKNFGGERGGLMVGRKTTDGVSCLNTLMDSINEDIRMTFV